MRSSAINIWSFKPGGPSWQWSLKTGFTVFFMVFALISGPVLTKYGVEEDMCEAKLVSLAQDTDLTFPSSIGK